MARKSMVELLADLTVSFPDNITGLITPQHVRDYFTDLIEAIRPAYGLLSKTSLTTQVLGTADAPVVFDTGYVSDVPDYSVTFGSGLIQRLEKGMTRITFNATVEAPTGRLINFTFYKNGVPTSWRASCTGSGAGKPVDVSFTALSYEGAAAAYQLQAKADSAGTTVTLTNMDMLAETVIVNTY